jgi:hypothetical protein
LGETVKVKGSSGYTCPAKWAGLSVSGYAAFPEITDRGFLDIVIIKPFPEDRRTGDFLVALFETAGS